MKLRITLTAELDEEALRLHDSDNAPPPADWTDWDGRDVMQANSHEILGEPEVVDIAAVGGEALEVHFKDEDEAEGATIGPVWFEAHGSRIDIGWHTRETAASLAEAVGAELTTW